MYIVFYSITCHFTVFPILSAFHLFSQKIMDLPLENNL